jgi:hypothetical protein
MARFRQLKCTSCKSAPAGTPVIVVGASIGATLMPMSADEHSARKSEHLRAFLASKAFYIAFGLYFASFLLPAVSLAGQPLFGYACAWMSLWLWASRENSFVPRDLWRPDQSTRDPLWRPKTVR